MTHVIDGLEGANLVERQADRSDRRARRIVLTAAGAQALQRTAERSRAEESRLLFGLSESQKAVLTQGLTFLAGQYGQGAQCGESVNGPKICEGFAGTAGVTCS